MGSIFRRDLLLNAGKLLFQSHSDPATSAATYILEADVNLDTADDDA
jgi:hypothetical protein